MKTILYIISLCALYVFLSVQIDVLAQSPAATRAYCDNNRNIAVQMTTQNLSTNLPIIVSQEVSKVSQSFVTNAYPVPVPVTNTVYVDTVISNQIIYQTTQTEVYATYSFTTNTYVNISSYTNIETFAISNILYPNSIGQELNMMISDDPDYDRMFSTNSHGMNMSFGRTYNDIYGLVPIYFHGTNRNNITVPENIYYLSDYTYGIRTNKACFGFQSSSDSIYLGKNIFNHSLLTGLLSSYDNPYAFISEGILSYITNNNIIIGNHISPSVYDSATTSYGYSRNLNVDGCVVISADPGNIPTNYVFRKKIKQIAGFENCILLDSLSFEEDEGSSSSKYSLGSYDNGNRIRNKICISTDNGLDDIMIRNKGENSYSDAINYTSLSQIIGQMVTNIVNQIRPQ